MSKNLIKKIKYFFIFCLLPISPVLAYTFAENSGLKNSATFAGYTEDLNKNPEEIITQGISLVLTFIGIIFLVLMIYGGFRWMIARGNESEVDKAKKVIIQSVIGLIIVFAAYIVSYFIISYFGGKTLS